MESNNPNRKIGIEKSVPKNQNRIFGIQDSALKIGIYRIRNRESSIPPQLAASADDTDQWGAERNIAKSESKKRNRKSEYRIQNRDSSPSHPSWRPAPMIPASGVPSAPYGIFRSCSAIASRKKRDEPRHKKALRANHYYGRE